MPSATLLPPSLRALEHLRLASFLCFGGICTAQISSEDSTDGGRRLPRLPGEVPGRGAADSAPGFLRIPPSPLLRLAGPGADRRCGGGENFGLYRDNAGPAPRGERGWQSPAPRSGARRRIAGILVIFAVGARWHPPLCRPGAPRGSRGGGGGRGTRGQRGEPERGRRRRRRGRRSRSSGSSRGGWGGGGGRPGPRRSFDAGRRVRSSPEPPLSSVLAASAGSRGWWCLLLLLLPLLLLHCIMLRDRSRQGRAEA